MGREKRREEEGGEEEWGEVAKLFNRKYQLYNMIRYILTFMILYMIILMHQIILFIKT